MNTNGKEEETLGQLSGEVLVPVTFEVTVEPRRRQKARKKLKVKSPRAQLAYNMVVPADTEVTLDDFLHLQADNYRIKVTANIYGKEYRQVYRNVNVDHIESVQMDMTDRIMWYVRRLNKCKKVGQGFKQELTVKVPLP